MQHVDATLANIKEEDTCASAGAAANSWIMSIDVANGRGPHVSINQPTASEVTGQMPAEQPQSESGLMKIWWALMQDQVGTLIRDMDALRVTNSQLLTRLDAQADMANDNMMLTSRLEQEVRSMRVAEQAENQERNGTLAKVWDAIGAESHKRNELRDEQQRVVLQLRSVLDEEIKARQDAHERQDEKVHNLLLNLRSEFRAELEQQSGLAREALQGQTVLKQAVERETRERAALEESVAETTRKLTVAVEKGMKSYISGQGMLQSQIESITRDISAERRDWGQRRAELQSKILHCLAEQEVMIAQERQARQEQYEHLLTQERQSRETHHETLLEKMSSESSVTSRQIAEHRNEFRQLLSDTVAEHAAEFRQLVTDMCLKERETSKEAYEALRVRLQEVLQENTVSKTEFTGEAKRLWQAVQQSPFRDTISLQSSPVRGNGLGDGMSSAEPTTASSLPGSMNVQSARPAKVFKAAEQTSNATVMSSALTTPKRMSSAPSVTSRQSQVHAQVVTDALPMEQLLANAGSLQSPLSPRHATVLPVSSAVHTSQRSLSPTTKRPLVTMPAAQACVCGSVFMPDAEFCRKCGSKRPVKMTARGGAEQMTRILSPHRPRSSAANLNRASPIMPSPMTRVGSAPSFVWQ